MCAETQRLIIAALFMLLPLATALTIFTIEDLKEKHCKYLAVREEREYAKNARYFYHHAPPLETELEHLRKLVMGPAVIFLPFRKKDMDIIREAAKQ
jgi:hypothetical protein